MKISISVDVPVESLTDTEAKGLLLSCLTSLMASHKANTIAPYQLFLRERLKERRDRKALNVILHKMTSVIAKSDKTLANGPARDLDGKKKVTPVTSSTKKEDTPQEPNKPKVEHSTRVGRVLVNLDSISKNMCERDEGNLLLPTNRPIASRLERLLEQHSFICK